MSSQPIRVIHTIAELREALAPLRASGRVAFVPTMGALHDGHIALVRHAATLAQTVVVSIFVNPLQFGPSEDLDRYPRTLDADVALLTPEGVSIVFAPSPAEMYPDGDLATRVVAGPAARLFEGATRPGHFDGVLTVVAKLFNLVQPDVVVFGRKDAQQLTLIRQMVRDLSIPVEIVGHETVREADGLARSSRNRYLGDDERLAAVTLSRALTAAVEAGAEGVVPARDAALKVLASEPLITLDYLSIVHPDTFEPVPDDYSGDALAIVAAKLGTTRLIDNMSVRVAESHR